MGNAIGSAAGSAGGAVANVLFKPFKDLFTKTCDDKCGAWDAGCYLENACGGSLIRLGKSTFLVCTLLLLAYLVLWKLGILKCLVKNACKISWKACWGSCRAMGGACGYLWHRLANPRRRQRRDDVEMGDLSWSGSSSIWSGSVSDWSGGIRARRRWPSRENRRRTERLQHSLHARRQISKVEHEYAARRSHGDRSPYHHHHHAHSSVHVRHGSLRHDRAITLHRDHRR
ncbi:hypothetical protein EJB05_13015, partial [Eragrostis curvula]